MADTARLNSNLEVFKQLTAVGLLRDNPATAAASTQLAAAPSAGDLSITVDDETGFAADDLVRIGEGDTLEENVVASTAAGSLVLKMPLAYDHEIDDEVHERVRIEVGEPSEDGVTFRTTTETEELPIATSRKPYLRQIVSATSELEFVTVNFNLQNLAASAGVPESSITGLGTSASPRRLALLDTALGTELNVSLWAQGVRQDGTTYEVQGWGVEMDPAQEINLRIGVGAGGIRFNGQAKAVAVCSPALP